mmetsp:Transcript_120648/g.196313  ORF Transcript_120648/g.196313 Transcript_120648/m.196313 type:complete len:816 (-) Transcript_120648:11-2458(-)
MLVKRCLLPQFVMVMMSRPGSAAPGPPQHPSKATGNKTVLVLRTDFPDSTSSSTAWFTASTASDWIGGMTDASTQLAAYYYKASLGRLRFGTVVVVPGVVRYPGARSEYNSVYELYDAIKRKMAADPSYSTMIPSNFDLVLIFWEKPYSGWTWAGQAYGGTPMVFAVNGGSDYDGDGQYAVCTTCSFGLLTHELSHCLGASIHASAWVPTPTAPASLASVPMCQSSTATSCVVDQGDVFDPLGWPGQTSGSQNQASIKWSWGFIQKSEVHWATANGGFGQRIRLYAHDIGPAAVPSASSNAFLAVAAQSGTDSSVWLWVEYKVAYARTWNDPQFTAAQQRALRSRGAILHLASGPQETWQGGISQPLLLHAASAGGAAPAWPAGWADAPLQVGRSLTLTNHKLVVTTLAAGCDANPPWLEVMVKRTPSDNSDTAPTIRAIEHSPTNVCAGQPVTLTCDVTDVGTDSSLLAYEWDMFDGMSTWNSESVRVRQWTFENAGSVSVRCTVSDGVGHVVSKLVTILVQGPAAHARQVTAADGANQCGGTMCAFIRNNKYNYPLVYLNGANSADTGWFAGQSWFTGFQAAVFAFDVVVVPKNTIVEVAHVVFRFGSSSANVGSVSIRVELSTSAAALTAGLNNDWRDCTNCLTTGRTWSSQAIEWQIPDRASGADVQTPNFAPLVREVISFSGWSGTGRIVVSLTPKSGGGVVSVEKDIAELILRWQTPGAGDGCPSLNLSSFASAAADVGSCSAAARWSSAATTTTSTTGGAPPIREGVKRATASDSWAFGLSPVIMALLFCMCERALIPVSSWTFAIRR